MFTKWTALVILTFKIYIYVKYSVDLCPKV